MKTDQDKIRLYDYWKREYSELLGRKEGMRKENEKLKKCVEFYADKDNWLKVNQFTFSRINEPMKYGQFHWGGDLARKTLKELML